MPTLLLTNERGYNAQINTKLVLNNGNILLAGEDGMIKIIEIIGAGNANNEIICTEFVLEKMLDSDGYLANIEEVLELENGNIVCLETLGNVGVYEKINKDKSEYKLKIIANADNKDCFYYLKNINDDKVEIWGELGIENKRIVSLK